MTSPAPRLTDMPAISATTVLPARRRFLHAARVTWTLALAIALAACGPDARHQATATIGPRTGTSSPSPAVAATYTLPAGTSAHTISVGKRRRTFLTYRPA